MTLPNDDKVNSVFSQDEYRKMVWKYFKDYEVRMPLKMLMCYTPWDEIIKTSRYRAEYARKLLDGTWLDSGFMVSGKCYFVGDDKVGYLLDAELMRNCLAAGQYADMEENGRKYNMFPKKEAIDYAVLITYFRRVIVPYGARIAPGAGVGTKYKTYEGGST